MNTQTLCDIERVVGDIRRAIIVSALRDFEESGTTPISVVNVSQKTRLSRPVISRHLDVLVELGFVKRVVDQADRRKCILTLTAKGSKLAEKLAA